MGDLQPTHRELEILKILWERERATVRGLGLRRMHQVVERQDTPMVRGMIKKIPHLVAVVE